MSIYPNYSDAQVVVSNRRLLLSLKQCNYNYMSFLCLILWSDKMNLQIKKAERKAKKLKAALVGPAGSGKTYTALELATGLKNGGRILLADTERGSSTLYADQFDFDVVEMPDAKVETFQAVISTAEKKKYDVLVIDSLSHAWEELLEEHEREMTRGQSKNSYIAWGKVTPIYRALIEAITASKIHIVATMRAKTEYVLVENDKGKKVPERRGLAPIFRSGGEYEFDLIGTLDIDHTLIVDKSRIDFMADEVIKKPNRQTGQKVRDWLQSGKNVEQKQESTPDADDAWIHILEAESSRYKGMTIAEIHEEDERWLAKASKPGKHQKSLTQKDMDAILACAAELDGWEMKK